MYLIHRNYNKKWPFSSHLETMKVEDDAENCYNSYRLFRSPVRTHSSVWTDGHFGLSERSGTSELRIIRVWIYSFYFHWSKLHAEVPKVWANPDSLSISVRPNWSIRSYGRSLLTTTSIRTILGVNSILFLHTECLRGSHTPTVWIELTFSSWLHHENR